MRVQTVRIEERRNAQNAPVMKMNFCTMSFKIKYKCRNTVTIWQENKIKEKQEHILIISDVEGLFRINAPFPQAGNLQLSTQGQRSGTPEM